MISDKIILERLPSKDEIEKVLTELKTVNLSKVSYERIYKVLDTLLANIPICTAEFPIGTEICRGRVHQSKGLFFSESEISYRTDYENIRMQRANDIKQSMFYGSLARQMKDCNEQWINDGIVTLLHECSPDLRNKKNLDQINRITWMTVGSWISVKPVRFVNICFNQKAKDANPIISESHNEYERAIRQDAKERTECILKILECISDEFAKENCPSDDAYKVSSAYTNFSITELFKKKIPVAGIVYPSVRAEFKGINVALNPIDVEECLELKKVELFKMYRDDSEIGIALTSELVATDLGPLNSNFKWLRGIDPIQQPDGSLRKTMVPYVHDSYGSLCE